MLMIETLPAALRGACLALLLLAPATARSETNSGMMGERSGDSFMKPTTSRLVFLGDSLTAGFQLARGSAYPALIQERIRSAGLPWDVLNAGVSGDTSAGALRRANAILRDPVGLLVLWIGANDGLRGQDLDAMKRNIDGILAAARVRNVPTLLVQMEIPPNYGSDYTERFREVYPELARKHQVPLVPFGLEGVAGESDLNLADGVHPNARGHQRMAETLWKAVEPHLRGLAR